MKAVIPVKSNSLRVPSKNFKEFHVYKPPSSRKDSKESFINL